MPLSFEMSPRQIHAQILSQTQQQSLQFLQYSQVDLFDRVSALCAANPFVEWIDPPSSRKQIQRNSAEATYGHPGNSTDEYLVQMPSLVDHLSTQLTIHTLDPEIRQAIQYMIGSLNDSGYLVESIDAIADVLSMDALRVERALRIFQTFDPPGIGARTLRECLLAQIDAIRESVRALALALIENHLEDIAAKRWGWLGETFGVSVEEIHTAVHEIQRLQPRPAFGYDTGSEASIQPDVILEAVSGTWVPRPNAAASPQIRIATVPDRVKNSADPATLRWYKERISEAEQVLGMLDRRTRTLLRIAQVIADTQQRFFVEGVSEMRPLTRKTVSLETGYHISTVSRAVQQKFILTPKGLYPFAYFFSSQLAGTDGSTLSSKAVKARLRELIQNEAPHRPWSDEELHQRCLDTHIAVSRRTIAKYREELGIPASRQRRR